MTVTSKPLVTGKDLENAQTTQYTATGVRTIIDKCTVYNHTAGAVALTINLVPSGGAAATSNAVISRNVAAGAVDTCPEVVGHALEPGGFISTLAGAATSLACRISGREVT